MAVFWIAIRAWDSHLVTEISQEVPMNTTMRVTLLALTTTVGVAVASSCSEDTQKGAAEFTIRNAVALGGEETLERHGIDVAGDLACRSDVTMSGEESFSVDCTGRTASGEALKLWGTGPLEDDPREPRGTFTATVDGRQLFEESCLGEC